MARNGPNQEISMLKVGDPVPEFSFTSEAFGAVSSSALRGKRYVMYFYPKDDTPGCTREACAFRDNLPRFSGLGIKVFGVSADDEKSHIRFARKHTLPFKLIPDPDHVICEAFGTWIEKSMYGRVYMGVARNTYVIGSDGKIVKIWEKVIPDGHAEEVFAWLNGDPVPTAIKLKLPTTVAAASRASKTPSKPASPVMVTKAVPTAATPAAVAASHPPRPSIAKPVMATTVIAKAVMAKARTAVAHPAAVKAKPIALVKPPVKKPLVKVPVAKPPAAKAVAAKKPAAKAAIAKKSIAKKPLTKSAIKQVAAKKKPPAKTAIKKVAAKKQPLVPKSAARKPAAKLPLKRKPPVVSKAKAAAKPIGKKPPIKRAMAKKPAAGKKPSAKSSKSRR